MKQRVLLGVWGLCVALWAWPAIDSDRASCRGDFPPSLLSCGAGTVFVVGPDGRFDWTLKGCGNVHQIAFPDGRWIYWSNASLWRTDVKTKKTELVYQPCPEDGLYGYEIHGSSVVVAENGTDRITELDLETKKILVQFKVSPLLKSGALPEPHHHLRLVHKTSKGTYLVCASGAHCVREYDAKGNLIWEQDAPNLAFDAQRLPNGNTLIAHLDALSEYTHDHRLVWRFACADAPELKLSNLCGIYLRGKNYVVGTYTNSAKDGSRTTAFELTPEKKVVWSYGLKGEKASMMTAVPLETNFFFSPLEAGFVAPPLSAKPHTWYHMMNGNVTKEGITCDFEAIAKAGLGGIQMFDAGLGIPPGPLAFNSPEWFDLLKHAASEARRLGLEMCIPNCSGWSSSGGPWNMPSNGMKKVVCSEVVVKGPRLWKGILPRIKKDNGFYEDIAVLAFPAPPAELVTFDDVQTQIQGTSARIENPTPFKLNGLSFQLRYPWVWNAQATLKIETSLDGKTFQEFKTVTVPLYTDGAPDFTQRFIPFEKSLTARTIKLSFDSPKVKLELVNVRPEVKARLSNAIGKTFGDCLPLVRDTFSTHADQVIPKDSVIDLTKSLKRDDSLIWDVPPGTWKILRFGFCCSGICNHPASKYGVGLEVDKLSASALDYHFEQYVGRICRTLGALAGDVPTGFNNILVDSYEVGAQNWTQGFESIFQQKMGYSLRPYLPTFQGMIVGSVEESERFLEDFRRVVGDLFAQNYAGALAKKCHAYGLKLSLEPYWYVPGDNYEYGQYADIPMGEFWSRVAHGDHYDAMNYAVSLAAQIAHVWGRRVIATESFTAEPATGGRWLTTPFSIKALGDKAYASGANRIIYHRFVHQPYPGNHYLPGFTMGHIGMHLDRTQTWWPYASHFFRYQARCQWLLQEGSFVADALFYVGEGVPNLRGQKDLMPHANHYQLPEGYAWDTVATAPLKKLRVVNGQIIAPSGLAYKMLVLPPTETMSEDVLHVISNLLAQGAPICAPKKPSRAPGLRGYPHADKRVRELVSRVWSQGVLVCSPEEALKKLNLEPDFAYSGVKGTKRPIYLHRQNASADWYFVALNNPDRETFEVSFRTTGRLPELWDAVTGERRPAPVWRTENNRTYVTLTFDPSGSQFVVFRQKSPPDGRAHVSVQTQPHAFARDDKSGVCDWYWREGKLMAVQPLTARCTSQKGATRVLKANPPAPIVLSDAWKVSFPVGWYTGEKTEKSFMWPSLKDWITDTDEDIRYFSGTATYEQTIPADRLSQFFQEHDGRLVLNLGLVKNFAEVTVNGTRFDALWKPPYQVDITSAVKPHTDVKLTVRVTNLWPNRLIGDDALPEDVTWVGSVNNGVKEIGVREIPSWVKEGKSSPTGRHTFTTWRHWTKDEPLLSSGLLGPVRLYCVQPAHEMKE